MTFICYRCKRRSHVTQEYHAYDNREFCSDKCFEGYYNTISFRVDVDPPKVFAPDAED